MHDHDDLELTPEERAAQEALRGMRALAPDPAFRARLKAAFTEGAFEDDPAAAEGVVGDRPALGEEPVGDRPGADEEAPPEPGWIRPVDDVADEDLPPWPPKVAPAPEGGPRRPHRYGRAPRSRSVWGWAALPLAAALLVVLATVWNRGPRWDVLETASIGSIRVDGVAMPVGADDLIETSLRAGSRILTPEDSRVTLLLPGAFAMQVAPGSEVRVTRMPGRWWGREIGLEVAHGEALLLSGPNFPGTKLVAATPEAKVEITGTSVSVFAFDGGSCVCVLEGTARIGADDADMVPVSAGSRRVFMRATGESPVLPIEPEHAHQLREFGAVAGPALARGADPRAREE